MQYKLGEEVEVRFIGKVISAYINEDGYITYDIKNDESVFSVRAKESQLFPLLTPDKIIDKSFDK